MEPPLSQARAGRALLNSPLVMVASPMQIPRQSYPAVLPWFLKSKKIIAGFVTFTPAKHLLVDPHLDTLCPSLEKSFANSEWLIFRGMWCPPPLCHPQAAKSARFTPTSQDSSSWGPHPKREEGREEERGRTTRHCVLHCINEH